MCFVLYLLLAEISRWRTSPQFPHFSNFSFTMCYTKTFQVTTTHDFRYTHTTFTAPGIHPGYNPHYTQSSLKAITVAVFVEWFLWGMFGIYVHMILCLLLQLHNAIWNKRVIILFWLKRSSMFPLLNETKIMAK